MISAYERDQRQPTLTTPLRLLRAAGFDLRLHLAAYDPHDLFRFPQAIQLPALARCGSADGAGGALPDC